MRILYGFILLVLLAAIGVFALQNRGDVTLNYLDRTLTTSLAILIGATYLLGMITGWTVLGFLRRSIHRVSQAPPRSN
ncbi:MAG TPA: lipopolysaccharide assembly protein LapA domain-containing protein [Planctomycetaceae bacterium]|jgi:putative membrane protein|nr:lipopolysaccharide assembly protein LapA domain-containing protein [Planctomycetaceae bacterium]